VQKKLKRGEEDPGGRKSIQKKLKRAEEDSGLEDPCRRN